MTKGTTSYRIKEDNGLYFLTFSCVYWIDILTKKNYRDVLINGLKYCQTNKGLMLIAWCIMSNHVHLIVKARDGYHLAHIIRDYKKFTSKRIIQLLQSTEDRRKDWILEMLLKAGRSNSKNQTYQLWRNDNHPILLDNNFIIDQKIEYIHLNPVKAEIVLYMEHYIYSSAFAFSGGDGLLNIEEN